MPWLDGESIRTESNLSSKVLKEILWCLGIEDTPFILKAQLIDEKLAGKRNHIAHGEFLDVDLADCQLLRGEVH